jgi:threonine/homoserine/homoserine lactone efflux protein
MKIAGGIYLAWMGIKMLRSSFNKISELDLKTDTAQKIE